MEAGLPGFKAIRDFFIEALREGRFENEARQALAEKNLLAVGDVSADEVIHMLQRCSGHQHEAGPHHVDGSITVHTFRPAVGPRQWYIKGYFLGEVAVFISVHPVEC